MGVIAFYANQPEGGEAYIPLYICSSQRGKGIFVMMLDKVKASVRHRCYSKIKLEVDKNNTRSQRAYLKAGFQFLPDKWGGKFQIYDFAHYIKFASCLGFLFCNCAKSHNYKYKNQE